MNAHDPIGSVVMNGDAFAIPRRARFAVMRFCFCARLGSALGGLCFCFCDGDLGVWRCWRCWRASTMLPGDVWGVRPAKPIGRGHPRSHVVCGACELCGACVVLVWCRLQWWSGTGQPGALVWTTRARACDGDEPVTRGDSEPPGLHLLQRVGGFSGRPPHGYGFRQPAWCRGTSPT